MRRKVLKPILSRLRALFDDSVVSDSWEQALGMGFQGFRGTHGSFQALFARSDVGLTLWFVLVGQGWELHVGVRKLMDDGQIAERTWLWEIESPIAFFMCVSNGNLLRVELNRVLDGFHVQRFRPRGRNGG